MGTADGMVGGCLPPLCVTLPAAAAVYGYTLTIATTISVLTGVHGTPDAGELLLFAIGGLAGFAALEVLPLAGRRAAATDAPAQRVPVRGRPQLPVDGRRIGLAHAIRGPVAWLVAPAAATTL